MTVNDFLFHRHDLAARLAAQLLGTDPLSMAGRSGVFMSAPRRTGKSTFLRADLTPVLTQAGALPVYVDLWADLARDPADHIADAVGEALAGVKGPVRNLGAAIAAVRKAAAKMEVPGFKAEFGFERESIGQPDGATLAKAFETLHERAGKPIVFILDEAQHALTSERGSQALFALKAARDALNLTASTPRLAILATGSLRGKISNLVLRKSQAFYGATIADFPTLGTDFVVHLARRMLGHRLTPQQMPSPKKLMDAFELLACRPEEMERAIRDAVVKPTRDLGRAIVEAAQEQRKTLLDEVRRQLDNLPALQQAILHRLHHLRDGESLEPFAPHSLRDYGRVSGTTPTTAQVQRALESLVHDGLLWRSSRGIYEFDDELLPQHFEELGWD